MTDKDFKDYQMEIGSQLTFTFEPDHATAFW